MKHLTHFFGKYPMEASVDTAVKMVKAKLELAIECLEKDMDEDEKYLDYLYHSYKMLQDIFAELNKNPDVY